MPQFISCCEHPNPKKNEFYDCATLFHNSYTHLPLKLMYPISLRSINLANLNCASIKNHMWSVYWLLHGDFVQIFPFSSETLNFSVVTNFYLIFHCNSFFPRLLSKGLVFFLLNKSIEFFHLLFMAQKCKKIHILWLFQ